MIVRYPIKITENYVLMVDGDDIIAHLPLRDSWKFYGTLLLPPLPEESQRPKEGFQFTEAEMRKCWILGAAHAKDVNSMSYPQLISSILEPKNVAFFECEKYEDDFVFRFRTNGNEIIGTYIYDDHLKKPNL